jgi:hypothetical protein
MWRIAERLWFVGRQAVRFCSIAGIGREWRLPDPYYYRYFYENCPDNENP